MIETENLTKRYGEHVAVDSLNLEVRSGEIYGFLGPNGAGKTTTIHMVLNLVQPTSGCVRLFGESLERGSFAFRQQIGVVAEEPVEFSRLTGWELTRYFGRLCGVDAPERRMEELFRALELWDARDALARDYSRGMRQKLSLIRALVHEPRLLILDEPTAGVDIEIRRSMWDFLRDINARGTTIILTTHYLEEAETLCRNIAIINGGLIAERDRMSTLLRKLQAETFVLNLRESITAVPQVPGYEFDLIDEHTLEVEVSKEQSLNEVFASLTAQGIGVLSMRNKVNRLEELFMKLVERKPGAEVRAP